VPQTQAKRKVIEEKLPKVFAALYLINYFNNFYNEIQIPFLIVAQFQFVGNGPN
jgi:hypothetical protein